MLKLTSLDQQISYTATVVYETYDVLLDPCDYMETTRADDLVKEMGLSPDSYELTACELLSQAAVDSLHIYTFTATVTSY